MSYLILTHDELRLVDPAPLTLVVRDSDGDAYGHARERARTAVSAADLHARRLAREAEAWLALARTSTRMREDTLVRKALGALAFSVQHGARSFAVPTKLVGVARHQRAVEALAAEAAEHPRGGLGLPLEVATGGALLLVSHRGEPLGALQGKHAPWATPVLGAGGRLVLLAVTGQDAAAGGDGRGYLGVNVAVAHVGEALGRLAGAPAAAPLPASTARRRPTPGAFGGDGASGDGASGDGLPAGNGATGDGASGDGLPAGGPPVLVAPAAGRPDPGDVVLWRDGAGVAHASCPAEGDVEWGYEGAGPHALARAVLAAVCGPGAVPLAGAFKRAVVAALPRAGGVLRAADVRAWAAAQGAEEAPGGPPRPGAHTDRPEAS